jgi:GntR family transcriptional repressor for pyruvate dehydrogenase complex
VDFGQRSAPEKRADAIASDLERRILEGTLAPGMRLPAEREMAAELGVSRPSLREALQKLASRGLLRSRQGGGHFVTDRLEAHFADPWRAMLASHPDLREDVLEFRRVLEGQMAEWAAVRRTGADIERLEARFTALEVSFAREGETAAARGAVDMAFHQAIAEAAHNTLSGHLAATLLSLMENDICLNLAELANTPRAFALLGTQHRTLFEAIRDGNAAAARSAAETHLDFVRESLAQSLRVLARRETAARRLKPTGLSLPPL